MRRHTDLVISFFHLNPSFEGLACGEIWIQSRNVGLQFLPFASRIVHEEHPRAMALHSRSIMQHLRNSGRSSRFVTFVAKQRHLKIIEEL